MFVGLWLQGVAPNSVPIGAWVNGSPALGSVQLPEKFFEWSVPSGFGCPISA